MSSENMKKLVEGLNSAGYDIIQLDFLYQNVTRRYGDIEILLWPVSKIESPFSTERIIKLFEVLSPLNYGLVTYNLLHERVPGEIKLILQTL
jgi:hypothetical protein